VFRAVKALGDELHKSKIEAAKAHGALKGEVTSLKAAVDARLTKQDLVLERMAGQLDVLVPMQRARPSSSETKAIVTQTITTHEKVSTAKWKRDIVLKIVGGVFSAGVLGALVHWVMS
jgi:hypothetical protein